MLALVTMFEMNANWGIKCVYVFMCPFHQDLLITISVLGTVSMGLKNHLNLLPIFSHCLMGRQISRLFPSCPCIKDFYLVCDTLH